MAAKKPASQNIESEAVAWALLCKRPKLWRYLWAYEAQKATLDECAAGSGLTPDEFNLLRSAAFRYERFAR